ncbi:MAG: hypothetical protein ACT4OT_09620 [Acidobacteriota bacterium]
MKDLLPKFIELERTLSEEKGGFSVFALFLREDAVEKWDLVVAAPWIEANRKEALSVITKKIQKSFTEKELFGLSRVVLVELSNPSVEAINQAIAIQHGQAEVRNSNFFGLHIKHAYVITSQRRMVNEPVPA